MVNPINTAGGLLFFHKENTACAEPLAKVEADVALILLLGKLYFPLGKKNSPLRGNPREGMTTH